MDTNNDTLPIVAIAVIVIIVAAAIAFSLAGHGGPNLSLR